MGLIPLRPRCSARSCSDRRTSFSFNLCRRTLAGLVIASCVAVFGVATPGAADILATTRQATLHASALTPPMFTQSGRWFSDPRGDRVVLRGFNAQPRDPAEYRRSVELGANFVRIPIYWSAIEPRPPVGADHFFDEPQLQELDAELRFLRWHRVAALLDFHQYGWSSYFDLPRSAFSVGAPKGIPAWVYRGSSFPRTREGRADAVASFYTGRAYLESFSQFVAAIVERYRNYPNLIGYEILNEPPTGSLAETHSATQTVIKWEARVAAGIRQEDPYRTIVFMLRGGEDFGLKRADFRPLLAMSPIALDLHDYFAGNVSNAFSSNGETASYPWSQTHLQVASAESGTVANHLRYLAPALRRTRKMNIPLFVGEWGARNNDRALSRYQKQMVAIYYREGINWARWKMARGGQFGLLKPNGKLRKSAIELASAAHMIQPR
jgi:hypothetical protein